MVYQSNIEEIIKFAEEINLDVKYLLGERYNGNLDLSFVTDIPNGVKFYIKGDLYLPNISCVPSDVVFNVGSYLNLKSVKYLANGIVFNVGGSLNLTNLEDLPDNTKFVVGRDLIMLSVGTIGSGVDILVGCSLFSYSTAVDIFKKCNVVLGKEYENGKVFWFVDNKYVKSENEIFEVLTTNEHVMSCQKLGMSDLAFVVNDGMKWSCGSTIKEANENLFYSVRDFDTSRYSTLTINSVLSLQEAVECYRTITKACLSGVKQFVMSTGVADRVTIEDVIKMTKYKFGNQIFEKFFDGR